MSPSQTDEEKGAGSSNYLLKDATPLADKPTHPMISSAVMAAPLNVSTSHPTPVAPTAADAVFGNPNTDYQHQLQVRELTQDVNLARRNHTNSLIREAGLKRENEAKKKELEKYYYENEKLKNQLKSYERDLISKYRTLMNWVIVLLLVLIYGWGVDRMVKKAKVDDWSDYIKISFVIYGLSGILGILILIKLKFQRMTTLNGVKDDGEREQLRGRLDTQWTVPLGCAVLGVIVFLFMT